MLWAFRVEAVIGPWVGLGTRAKFSRGDRKGTHNASKGKTTLGKSTSEEGTQSVEDGGEVDGEIS